MCHHVTDLNTLGRGIEQKILPRGTTSGAQSWVLNLFATFFKKHSRVFLKLKVFRGHSITNQKENKGFDPHFT